MIIPSAGFRNELFIGNRKYLVSAYLYSSSGTFVITNAQVWEKSLAFEDTVNSDDVFDVGNAIINKFTVGLNNINEQYSGIVFKDAVIIPSVGLLVNGQAEMLQKGIFIVDDCKYDGSIIKLTCLDLMERFDRPYDTDLTFPATLLQIVQDACTKCGIRINNVAYPTAPQTFPNYDYQVAKKPESDTVTYREVISWCAQIAGCFARVSRLGALEFKWFDTVALASLNANLDGGVFDSGTTPYHSGDTADGGGFHTGGDTYDGGSFTEYTDVDFITECFSTDVAVDATLVEGVKVTYAVEDTSGTHVRTATEGNQNGFKVLITDNDFIASDEQAVLVCQTIKDNVIGMRFYRADASHLSDPCIEAGDVGMMRNFRGNYFPIIISRTKFGISVSQNTASNAETDSRNTSYRDMPAINVNTNVPDINIPTDLIVITAPDGEDWAIHIDDLGNISTTKVPKRIYFNVNPKLDYFPGDLLDVSDAVVHAVYNDGTEIDVTADCTFDPPAGFEIPDITGTFEIVATWTFTPGQAVGGGGS